MLTADPPFPTFPQKPRHASFKFLTRAPSTRSLCLPYLPAPSVLFWARKSASPQGATDWCPPAGTAVLPMASVGEPINRPRYTGQRDRSQTVLAAPRVTREPHLINPSGAPFAGRPGLGKLSSAHRTTVFVRLVHRTTSTCASSLNRLGDRLLTTSKKCSFRTRRNVSVELVPPAARHRLWQNRLI